MKPKITFKECQLPEPLTWEVEGISIWALRRFGLVKQTYAVLESLKSSLLIYSSLKSFHPPTHFIQAVQN